MRNFKFIYLFEKDYLCLNLNLNQTISKGTPLNVEMKNIISSITNNSFKLVMSKFDFLSELSRIMFSTASIHNGP